MVNVSRVLNEVTDAGVDGSEYEKRALIYVPERAFDHGLTDVPIATFYDELERVLDPGAPTGTVVLDLSEALGLAYPATTPMFLARYNLVRRNDLLEHEFSGAVEVHYVLRGSGSSRNRQDEIGWAEGDCFSFPGGAATEHRASDEALLFSISNDPELEFNHSRPSPALPVAAAVWRRAQIDAAIDRMYERDGPLKTAGKSASFTTAAMNSQLAGAMSPSMMAAVNTLEPGGVQKRHRHNSVAVTVPLECEGTYSVVGDQRIDWRRFGVIVTPPRMPHSHINDGTARMTSFVAQDGPLFYNCRSIGFEWTDSLF